MEETCSPLLNEFEDIEKLIKNVIVKIEKSDREEVQYLQNEERELEEKREKIVKQINACRSGWDVFY